ncbi:MAG: class I SAM-dependent methyltransferase [Pseudomonadota bacterium]
MNPADLQQRIAESAAARYRAAGRFAYYFAKGKLSGDPVFAAILAQELVPDNARILDLGCGQAILASWLLAARECHGSGDWYESWPQPPRSWTFHGFELAPRDVSRANLALGDFALVEIGDIRTASFGNADVIVILDVLHYMDPANQESVLDRARLALSPDGVLLLRIGDASGGLAFRLSNWLDQAVVFVRAHRWARLHCRPAVAWMKLLAGMGFNVRAIHMSAGTPFCDVLLVAQPR